jgi:hypothetical protein
VREERNTTKTTQDERDHKEMSADKRGSKKEKRREKREERKKERTRVDYYYWY